MITLAINIAAFLFLAFIVVVVIIGIATVFGHGV